MPAKRLTNFRLNVETFDGMDRLITNPPAQLIDPRRGVPRNKTELIELLVKQAVEAAFKDDSADHGQAGKPDHAASKPQRSKR